MCGGGRKSKIAVAPKKLSCASESPVVPIVVNIVERRVEQRSPTSNFPSWVGPEIDLATLGLILLLNESGC